MAKVIEGVALIGGAIALSAFSAGIGGAVLGTLIATSAGQIAAVMAVATAVGSLGVSLLASGISQALGFGPSQPFSLKSPSSPRQAIYGQTRCSGTIVYCSASGSGQFLNFVVIWAGHQISSIDSLYLDARSVLPMQATETYAQCDSNQHTDSAGNNYNFEGCVYSEHFLGNPSGHWFESLYSNDPTWNSTCLCNGLAASYIRLTFSASVFPSEPGMKLNVHGKILFDPRLGTYGAAGTTAYSNNAALCLLDVLLDTEYGLGCLITEIDLPNFVMAANLCDEQIELASGLLESRYCVNGAFSYDSPPGEIISAMLVAMAGRITYVQGQFQCYPGAFYGSGAIYDSTSILAPVKWTARKKYRDTFNCVRAKWVSPRYPYNTPGYDQDHKNTDPAIFGGEWEPCDAPPYAEDVLHNYPEDANLIADGGFKLYLDMSLRFCTSISQCQRIMAINLKRNRQLGSGTWQMNLSAMLSQPQDVIQLDFPALSLLSQYHEISTMRFNVVDDDSGIDDGEGSVKGKHIVVELDTVATDPSVYLWSTAEELTFNDTPGLVIGQTWTVLPVTDMLCESGSDSAVVGYDGITIPRINVTFLPTIDPFTISGGHYELQIQKAASPATWTSVGTYDTSISQIFVSNVVCNVGYNLQLRAVRSNGMASTWAQVLSHVVSITLSTFTSETISGLGALASLNYIDFSSGTEITNKTANNLLYANGYTVESLRPFESLADQTAGKSLDILADGVTYQRVLGSQLLQGFLSGGSNGANILANGGFEFNLSGVFPLAAIGLNAPVCDNWYVAMIGTGIDALYDTTTSRSGGACLEIFTVAGAAVTGSNNGVRVFSTKTACLGGAYLNYGGYVNVQANTPVPTGAAMVVRVGLYFYAANGTFLSEDYSQHTYVAGTLASASGYTLYQGYCVVPMNAAQMCFDCCLFSSIGAFTPPAGLTVLEARFDDCFINQTYPSSTLFISQGSITPTSLPSITFTYTSSSISLSWSTTTILRADGNSATFAAGSQTISGLTASAGYWIYMYGDIPTLTFQFVSLTLSTTPNASSALAAASDGRMPLLPFQVTTTSSGSGSGSSGAGVCPESEEIVHVDGKGEITAGEVEVGDMILGRCFVSNMNVYRKVISVATQASSSWRIVDGHRISPCEPVWSGTAWIPAYKMAGAHLDMQFGKKIMLTLKSDSYNESNYYLVSGTELLIHNSPVAPC